MAKKIKNDKMLFAMAALFQLVGDSAAKTNRITCDGLVYRGVYFDRDTLVANLGRPYSLVVHKFSGNLFFSHTVQIGSNVDFSIMSCHIGRKKCSEIKGVSGGHAVAYDDDHDEIYFGGHDGIYKYNYLNRSAEFFAVAGTSIWGLFVRANFYYIEYPTQRLFIYRNNISIAVAEAMNIEIDNFFVSKPGHVYFSNRTAIYKHSVTKQVTVVLDDQIVVRQIVEDKYGDVYVCGGDGVYVEDKPYNRLKKIAVIDKAFGLAFDEDDHVIYSDNDAIYRLLPSSNSDICFNKINYINQYAHNGFDDHILD